MTSRAEGLWAITSFFNPLASQRRLANYRIFRRHMQVPLIAVELGFDSPFALGADDADLLVQVRGGDLLWQKERLLNLALRSLPPDCDKVVWADCDVVLRDESWAERLARLLDRYMVVQPYGEVQHAQADWSGGEPEAPAIEFAQASVTSLIASGMSAADALGHLRYVRQSASAKGHVWAARRELLDQCGLYDTHIIGGGDRAMACAFYGCFDEAIRIHCMAPRQSEHYLAWARRCHDIVRGAAGGMDGKIVHLWHGHIHNRANLSRHEEFRRFDFDPENDIAADGNGPWRWASEKPDMHAYVRGYFESRKEDEWAA